MSVIAQKICLKGATMLIFMLLMQFTKAQYDFSEVGKKLDAHKKELGNNVVVLIYKDGKIVYKKEIGTDFTATTRVPIASCSKWLTAAMVMTFVDEGKLSLDDKVSDFLPIFALYGKKYITIRHCLTHFTGIEAHGLLASIIEHRRYATLEEEVNAFASKHEIETNPGTAFKYSTIGLNIAARVCEVVGKKSFDQLMANRILKPCAMRATTFESEKALNPSGGAQSTALDYTNFLSMILNKGNFKGKQVLSEKAIADMQTSYTTPATIKYAPDAAKGYNYGLGEWIEESDNHGNANVVCCPGLFGTWPLVDKCRGYTCIFLVKTILNEERRAIYLSIKKNIDEIIGINCTQ